MLYVTVPPLEKSSKDRDSPHGEQRTPSSNPLLYSRVPHTAPETSVVFVLSVTGRNYAIISQLTSLVTRLHYYQLSLRCTPVLHAAPRQTTSEPYSPLHPFPTFPSPSTPCPSLSSLLLRCTEKATDGSRHTTNSVARGRKKKNEPQPPTFIFLSENNMFKR